LHLSLSNISTNAEEKSVANTVQRECIPPPGIKVQAKRFADSIVPSVYGLCTIQPVSDEQSFVLNPRASWAAGEKLRCSCSPGSAKAGRWRTRTAEYEY